MSFLIPQDKQAVEVVMTLHLDSPDNVAHTIKLGCQLLSLLGLTGESDIQYAIFGDTVMFARVVTKCEFVDLFTPDLPLN